MSALKLNLGCGSRRLDGWINVDCVKEFEPDLVHDLSRPLPYADRTVDEIMALDLLEHFDKYQRHLVFYDWVRALKVGGLITLQVPHFPKILFRYFKWNFDHLVDTIFGETMFNAQHYLGHFGNHKWGYSPKTLKAFVETFGVMPLETKEDGLNIYLKGRKERQLTSADLDKITIYSPANSVGEDPYLSMGFVKERMDAFRQDV